MKYAKTLGPPQEFGASARYIAHLLLVTLVALPVFEFPIVAHERCLMWEARDPRLQGFFLFCFSSAFL